ncbi:MAG: hypothetical protein ACK4IX_06690 [Candidatus Sericytochromatia bacterium]
MATKVGRPRKYKEEPISWGMKITIEGREKIKLLSKFLKKPSSEIIMELVEKELNNLQLKQQSKLTRRISASELRSMPKEQRDQILKEQTEIAMLDYEIIPDCFDIVED